MKYEIKYNYNGKEYSRNAEKEVKVPERQYEAVANELLLMSMEENGLPRGVIYHDVVLLEIGDTIQPVWGQEEYLMDSIEVQ